MPTSPVDDPPLPVVSSVAGALVAGGVVPLLGLLLVRLALGGTGDLEVVTSWLAPSLGSVVYGMAYFLAEADEEGRYEVAGSMGLGMGFGTAAVTAWTWSGSATAAWIAPVTTLWLLLLVRWSLHRERGPERRRAGLLSAVVGWGVGVGWSMAMVWSWLPA